MNEDFLKAVAYCEQQNFQAAIPVFNKVLNQNPQHAESLFNRGLAYFMLQQYDKALQDFDAALVILPSQARIYAERAVTKHHLKDQRGALDDFNKALALEPQNPYRYSSRAYLRAFIGDTEGGIEDYKKAVELDPDDAIAYNNLGLLEEKLGYKAAAKASFDKADALADKGKTFSKPSVEDALQAYEERKAAEKEAMRLQMQPKGTGENITSVAPKTKDYLHIMKQVFTSKETFREFWQFLKGKQTKL